MLNNLSKIERNLRNLAKRYRSINYSINLIILFLMMGIGAFSQEINNLHTNEIPTRENLRNLNENLQSKIQKVKAKNEKDVAGLKLELVQLMEQGDQVIKSPWTSWQFGINYMYNNWRGRYKGRGSLPFIELVNTAEPALNLGISSEIDTRKIDKPLLNKEMIQTVRTLKIDINKPVSVIEPSVTLNMPKPNTKPFNDFSFKPDRLGSYEAGRTTTSALIVNEEKNVVYTLGVNPNNPDINPDNLQVGDLNNKAYRYVNGIDKSSYADIDTVIHSTARYIRQEASTIWRINNKYKSLRDKDNENDWISDMSEDVNNPIVHGFTYGGFSDTNRVKFYIAGDIKNDGSNLLGINSKKRGAIALHSVWNGTYQNIEGYLKGRAAMFSIETWHSPKLVFKNIEIDIQGNENTLFYIYPTGYEGVIQKLNGSDYNSFSQRGTFIGEVNADIKSQKNVIYSIMGLSGSFNITSTGTYRLEGSNNIIYSGLGYSPNFQNFIGNDAANGWVSDRYKTGMTPVINLKTAPESYGDGNVIMYFSDLLPDDTVEYPKTHIYGGDYDKWKKSKIGIYQGEIKASARIGEKLNFDNGLSQTTEGNKIQQLDGTLINGNNKYVENNVGILAQSGQRGAVGTRKITPTEDLGANGFGWVDKDNIHALYVNDIDITFGKYSKSGIMIAAERGTQVDVAIEDNTNPHHTNVVKDGSGNPIIGKNDKATIPIRTTPILDYNKEHSTYNNDNKIISSAIDSQNEAAIGTIIAYAKGSWKDSDTRMSTTDGMSATTRNAFKDAKSEINFGVPVEMSAKYAEINGKKYTPAAYVADGGKITAKDTTAYGYGSIIAYAKNQMDGSTVKSSGEIEINGNIEAIDKWVANDANTNEEKYKNVGAYVGGEGSKIKVTGNVLINGIGAFAENKGNVVISGTRSILNSGNSTALAALNGGNITFGGGDIFIGNNAKNNTVPFYTDTNANSKINFTGPTKVKMTKGAFIVKEASRYQAGVATTNTNGEITDGTNYNGMSNVELDVSEEAKIVKNTIGGPTVIWNGPASLVSDIKNTTQLNKINAPISNYLLYYSNADYVINTDSQLGNPTAVDSFDIIKMTREKVTINPGKKVYSTTGVGLQMASSNGATSNAISGYENNGTVDISGEGAAKAAINISYGTIKNNGTVNIDKGAALYGTNGSKIENTNNGIVNVTNFGYGIVGMATGKSPEDYGRDVSTGMAVEIINNGQINIAGDNAIAIYADDNKGVALNEISISNSHKIFLDGNTSIGIALRDSKNSGSGGILNTTGSGSSDIVTGTNGIGIYTENSVINLNSNYGIETKDGGVGIYAAKSSIPTATTLEYKYSGSNLGRGIAVVYTGVNATNNTNIKLVNSTKTVGGLIGIFDNGQGTFTNNGTITGSSTAKEFGIIGESNNIINNGNINLGNATSIKAPNIAIYSKTENSITNTASIKVGNNSTGFYGYTINNSGDITVGSKGTAIYSQGGNVDISSGTINIGSNQAIGVHTDGNSQIIRSNATSMNIEDNSFGFVNLGEGNRLIAQTANVSLKNNSMYIYSKNNATINNSTNLRAVGTTGNNYGIYASGTVVNKGDIDFKTGLGNIGIYSTDGGRATNNATISIGDSDEKKSIHSIGMAAGFIGDKNIAPYSGNIVNNGTINVAGKDSIGMYGVGSETTVYNGTTKGSTATINLSADGAVGIYLDEGAKGYNYGTITTVGNPKKAVGIIIKKDAEFTNEGTITINSTDGYAFLKANGGIIKNYGTFTISGGAQKEGVPENRITGQKIRGVEIEARVGSLEAKITDPLGNIVKPTLVPISSEKIAPSISSIGMYIDTLRTTYPINGLSAIKLDKAHLIVGSEAAQKTTSKYIKVSQDILKPYNKAIASNPQIAEWDIYSGALTWIARATINKNTGLLNNLYIAKIPYTLVAGDNSIPINDKDKYNFLVGLEERYGVENIGTRENQVFQKLNEIKKDKKSLFLEATNEMMGYQYSNIQQRVQETGIILDKEFNYLRKEWRTVSKDSNKIKVFGTNGEYKTDTVGVMDYKYNAYGVAFLHENENVKLGNSIGWYTGIVHNKIKFEDSGRSKEEQLQGKIGIFKSVPFDHNNSLNWTISGDIFAGYNKMNRRFLVVDEVFNAKAKYYSYGIGLKNEIGKEFRLSESFRLRPYGALKLEYGKISKIKEKSGEIKLEVKQNDYASIKPEIGTELVFRQFFGKNALKTSFNIAYENELGRVANGKNQAKVRNTDADWFNIRGEKEDRRGNVKSDLNIGWDNQRIGVTANTGYDTKGHNVRAGVGLRVIF